MDILDEHDVVVSIPADHPCLPGHFPGRPIVPAVLVLDEVRGALQTVFPRSGIKAIEQAKFLDVILPEHPFRIALKPRGDSTVDFTCSDVGDDRPLASGRLLLDTEGGS